MSEDNSQKRIGWLVNTAMTCICFALSTILWLGKPVRERMMNIESIVQGSGYDLGVGGRIFVALGIFLTVSLLSILLIKIFWNRFVVPILGRGTINLAEAYCLFLFLTFLSTILCY